ncbi:MAG: hypothetical protein BGO51_05195 [Rhodospirillales bacterium 69-11]|jgi:hypothetical protein|nr:hypothetical protein [Rhodospirillales bacterium]OJW27131.1 MAG: hypothetical protein BGO51_05195 [Rhodospirillales bacterium 69-11]
MSERRYDKTVADTFPASDPPANSGTTGAEPPRREGGDNSPGGDKPTGRPTSDRSETEMADGKPGDPHTTKP